MEECLGNQNQKNKAKQFDCLSSILEHLDATSQGKIDSIEDYDENEMLDTTFPPLRDDVCSFEPGSCDDQDDIDNGDEHFSPPDTVILPDEDNCDDVEWCAMDEASPQSPVEALGVSTYPQYLLVVVMCIAIISLRFVSLSFIIILIVVPG